MFNLEEYKKAHMLKLEMVSSIRFYLSVVMEDLLSTLQVFTQKCIDSVNIAKITYVVF